MSNWKAPQFKLAFAIIAMITVSGTPVLADSSTFKSVCAECHTGGIKGFVSGAPNVNKPASWQKFLDRNSDERMREVVLRGTKDHKPKGDCATCSDQQVLDAIDYIMTRVK